MDAVTFKHIFLSQSEKSSYKYTSEGMKVKAPSGYL